MHSILRGANLNGISANEADFRGADFGISSCPPIDFEKRDINTFRSKRTYINNALISRACFADANMREVEMKESILNSTQFVEADLSDAQLTGSHLKGADLTGVNLKNANLENVNVFDVIFDRSGKYRGVRLSGCYGSARFERFAKDQNYLEELRDGSRTGKVLYALWFTLADCGRTPWRWLLWSSLSIFCFGVLFANYDLPNWLAWMPDDLKQVLSDIRPILKGGDRTPFTPYYFSIVTFTTLGFGDVAPLNLAGEIWVSLEVILGYVMLGGLISILATIIARRGD